MFRGVDALSDFQQKRLIKRLKSIDPSINSVSAEYVHFVQSNKTLSPKAEEQLSQLLAYDSPYTGSRSGQLFLVVPRIGTTSPWSSKATDIAHNTGLKNIQRVERGIAYYVSSRAGQAPDAISSALHDRMTETVLSNFNQAKRLFQEADPKPVTFIRILEDGIEALKQANTDLGLALADDEISYLYDEFINLQRNPSDMEITMFAQVNSEHCRHKIFNANWEIDGKAQPKSLFKMIKNTYEKHNDGIISAYSDNAAILSGPSVRRFSANFKEKKYKHTNKTAHLVIKAETHNHPTAIAPFPGAGTGAGGEIRDEAATGRSAKTKMGFTGYTVSNLNIPGTKLPWEKKQFNKPGRIASPLDIMIEAPIGGATYNNEFGRPNLAGYFRTFEQPMNGMADSIWGYHKPIMIAGGLGNIQQENVTKKKLQPGTCLIVLGGPAMLIGLGGGAASSMQTGKSEENLDFSSVQRPNAEIERRAQEVINSCGELGNKNPIASIHDVGAGGLSNALPELVNDSGLGATIELRDIPSAEKSMSPMEIWCNEAQERYVMGIQEKDLAIFKAICERERCPFAVVGKTTKEPHLAVHDRKFKNKPVDIDMSTLFGKSPKITKRAKTVAGETKALNVSRISLGDAAKKVLRVPAVASKKFLITIGDRSVGGMTARDQMVGPWQVPVSDVAVTASSFEGNTGEASAMGERTPLAINNPAASSRMAVGEAITNIAASNIKQISDIKLSANWMAASGYEDEDYKLHEAVKAIGEELCPKLGITIPVGKDSLSMRTVWQEKGKEKSATSPVSLIVSAFSPVVDIKKTLTPVLSKDTESVLILVDLGEGKNRLGGSALSQSYSLTGGETPDVDQPEQLKSFFDSIQSLNEQGLLLAYHDRSDGGLFTSICEMMFAGRCGASLDIGSLPGTDVSKLFNEELGAVLQVNSKGSDKVLKLLKKNIGQNVFIIGKPTDEQRLVVRSGKKIVYENTRRQLESWWAETSYRIQRLRDNPLCADQEFEAINNDEDPGLVCTTLFSVNKKRYAKRPEVAILREQGVNGQLEMAAAFDAAGFTSVDVHMQDLINGSVSLDSFVGLAGCGGFSYGDVLSAGGGWSKCILYNQELRRQLGGFFKRKDTFYLGVCNGCQMLAGLKELIPGAGHWPKFMRNTSEQFEARVVNLRIDKSPSIFFSGMEESVLPVVVAHGEGRAVFDNNQEKADGYISARYVDSFGKVTDKYPANPNGSINGIAALTSKDGRATIMMPHPERGFLTYQNSWHPKDWGEYGPWFKMFQNAREWVG